MQPDSDAWLLADLCAYCDDQRETWGDIDEATIVRYLGNELSVEERERVEIAQEQHLHLRSLIELAEDLMEEGGFADEPPPAPPPPPLTNVPPRGGEGQAPEEPPIIRMPPRKRASALGRYAKAACILVVAGGACAGALYYGYHTLETNLGKQVADLEAVRDNLTTRAARAEEALETLQKTYRRQADQDAAVLKKREKEVNENIHAMRKAQRKMADKLDRAQRQVAALTKENSQLRKVLAPSTVSEYGPAGDVLTPPNQLQDLRKSIASARQEIANLRIDLGELRKSSASPYSSAYAPTGPAVVSHQPASGHIRLINTFAEAVTVVLNDNDSYQLAPGQTRVVDAPPGAFTYEVVGVQPRRTRILAADKTFTIRVHAPLRNSALP